MEAGAPGGAGLNKIIERGRHRQYPAANGLEPQELIANHQLHGDRQQGRNEDEASAQSKAR